MADVHVTGLKELNEFLQQLPIRMEKNVLRGGLRAGMKVVQPVAKSNLRSRSGEIKLKINTRAKGGKVTASLKAKHLNKKGAPDNLPIWVEYGTAAHYISVQEEEKPINRRLSAYFGRVVRASMTTVNRNVLKIGANFVGPTVWHPGARPRPWMRPALDSQAQNAVVAVARYIRERLATKNGLDTSGVTLEGDE